MKSKVNTPPIIRSIPTSSPFDFPVWNLITRYNTKESQSNLITDITMPIIPVKWKKFSNPNPASPNIADIIENPKTIYAMITPAKFIPLFFIWFLSFGIILSIIKNYDREILQI